MKGMRSKKLRVGLFFVPQLSSATPAPRVSVGLLGASAGGIRPIARVLVSYFCPQPQFQRLAGVGPKMACSEPIRALQWVNFLGLRKWEPASLLLSGELPRHLNA